MSIETENRELHSMRTVGRELSGLLAELESGDLEKVVITKHGRMVAVVVTIGSYEKLADGKK